MTVLYDLMRRLVALEREAHAILSVHETSVSRVVRLDQTYRALAALSLKQDELLRQGLRCIENGLFRAAHVMAWASFMDFVEEKVSSDGFRRLNAARLKWKIKTVEDLRERIPEHQIIEATRELKLCTTKEMKALLGLLNKRNECAHPSDYFPGLNESLGYVSEILQRITNLRKKVL